MKNIAVFASGKGSNFVAIDASIKQGIIDANLCLLVSDKPNSLSVKKAEELGIECFAFDAKQYASKKDYERIILKKLQEKNIDLVILAGYMRLIGSTLLHNYPGRIINIHPSLLPAFKGKDAVGQAMATGVKVTGVTVHFVDEGMDTGKIISQRALDISTLKSREEIEREIHKIEHILYPITINKVLEDLR